MTFSCSFADFSQIVVQGGRAWNDSHAGLLLPERAPEDGARSDGRSETGNRCPSWEMNRGRRETQRVVNVVRRAVGDSS